MENIKVVNALAGKWQAIKYSNFSCTFGRRSRKNTPKTANKKAWNKGLREESKAIARQF